MLGLALACASIYTQANAADPAPAQGKIVPAVVNFGTCARPVWPVGAIAAKKTGTVTLSFLIGVDGKLKGSRIVKSSGHVELDEAARTGIEKCTFKPGTRDGDPIEGWNMMQYVWALD
jgi:D-alanyl-D-alanine endopeptidase (penicillin-binding protein 7)